MAGKGCITLKNGKFYLVISKGRVGNTYKNKWVSLRATTALEAEIERQGIVTDQRRGVWLEPSNVTVGDFTQQFLSDMGRSVKRGRTAEATHEWYERRIRLHIIPEIGGLRFTDIRARDLQNLYDDLYYQSVNKAEAVYRILHAVWAAAVQDDDLDVRYNLADKIKRGERERYQALTWTPDQVTYFLKLSKEHHPLKFYTVFLLGFGAGLRLGEILGLTWDCIDYQNMTLEVKRSITLNKAWDPDKVFKKTKTYSSMRTIRMIPVIADTLKRLYKNQLEECLKAEKYLRYNLVMATEIGKPLNYSNLYHNYWGDFIRGITSSEKVLPYMKPHGMRHSCATWLYSMGVPIEHIQDILGHSTQVITKLLYVHTQVGVQDRAMRLIQDRFVEAGL